MPAISNSAKFCQNIEFMSFFSDHTCVSDFQLRNVFVIVMIRRRLNQNYAYDVLHSAPAHYIILFSQK